MINRRKFVSLNAAALCLSPFAGFSFPTGNDQMKALVKPTWLIDLIKLNDTYLNGSNANKIKDKFNPYFGARLDGELIPNPHSTSKYLNISCAAVATP